MKKKKKLEPVCQRKLQQQARVIQNNLVTRTEKLSQEVFAGYQFPEWHLPTTTTDKMRKFSLS